MADNMTVAQLENLLHSLRDDPDNRAKKPGIHLFDKRTYKRIDNITWAIRQKTKGEINDMKPQPKKELVISKGTGYTFFDVTVASEDAAEWLKSEAAQFGRLLPDTFISNKFFMAVGDEYDADEVAAYLDTYNAETK